MKANENKHCFVPCSEDKVNAGQCGCLNRISHERVLEKLTICPNCGNNKLIDIAEELEGGYKCIDCGIRFKK